MKALYCLSIICISVGLVSCEAMAQMQQQARQQWIAENCVKSEAYNNGLRDGMTPGVNPQRNYASICPRDNSILNSAYLTGFAIGMASRPPVTTANTNVAWGNNPPNPVTSPFPPEREDWFDRHARRYYERRAQEAQQTDVRQSAVQQSPVEQSPVQQSSISQSPIQQSDPSQSPVQKKSDWSW